MSVCNRHPVTLCSPLQMPAFTVGQTLPSFHGFDFLPYERKLPASVCWLWSLGCGEQIHIAVFPLLCCCLLQASHSPSEVTSLFLLICPWLHGAGRGCSDPIYPLPLPRASSREDQSFCPFLGSHALCFLFCVPSALETSVMFVSSLEKLKDNTYFIPHSCLYRNELQDQKRHPPPLQAAP